MSECNIDIQTDNKIMDYAMDILTHTKIQWFQNHQEPGPHQPEDIM